MRLDDETRRRWEEAADRKGVSLSNFVRSCVDAEIGGTIPAHFVLAPSAGKRTFAPDFKKSMAKK